jgi:hypothetical protein
MQVFRIIIQSPESKVSLVRFPFDFIEFHQKVILKKQEAKTK